MPQDCFLCCSSIEDYRTTQSDAPLEFEGEVYCETCFVDEIKQVASDRQSQIQKLESKSTEMKDLLARSWESLDHSLPDIKSERSWESHERINGPDYLEWLDDMIVEHESLMSDIQKATQVHTMADIKRAAMSQDI